MREKQKKGKGKVTKKINSMDYSLSIYWVFHRKLIRGKETILSQYQKVAYKQRGKLFAFHCVLQTEIAKYFNFEITRNVNLKVQETLNLMSFMTLHTEAFTGFLFIIQNAQILDPSTSKLCSTHLTMMNIIILECKSYISNKIKSICFPKIISTQLLS